MPLISHIHDDDCGQLWLWKQTEPLDELVNQLDISPELLAEINNYHPKRLKEWIGGRCLIQKTLGLYPDQILIDEFGKPHLKDGTPNISLSHSGSFVALGTAERPIGIDVQIWRRKISKISHKFCNPAEHRLLSSYLKGEIQDHYIWSIKEAIYKAYGRKQLDFKKHILLTSIEEQEGNLVVEGAIKKNRLRLNYHLKVSHEHGVVIARAVQLS